MGRGLGGGGTSQLSRHWSPEPCEEAHMPGPRGEACVTQAGGGLCVVCTTSPAVSGESPHITQHVKQPGGASTCTRADLQPRV